MMTKVKKIKIFLIKKFKGPPCRTMLNTFVKRRKEKVFPVVRSG